MRDGSWLFTESERNATEARLGARRRNRARYAHGCCTPGIEIGTLMSERLGILALLGAFLGGSLLVMLADGPAWLAIGYAAVGAGLAFYRLRNGARRRPAAYIPGPRLNQAGQLVIAPSPARRPAPAPTEPLRAPAPPEAPRAPEATTSERAALGTSALGYVLVGRTPSDGAEDPGDAIRALCASRRLNLRRIARDVEAARGDAQARPALRWALDQLAADEAQTLVVAKLGHLTDTAAGLPELLRWLSGRKRRLIAIDVQLDTATEAGGLTVGALSQVGGWERERISQRTRRGLEAARSRGAVGGRPSVADVPELRDRIVAMRRDGMTLQAIADVLNEEGVPTLRGGAKWRPSSVQAATGYRRPAAAKRLRLPPQERPADKSGPG
jgi:DNA invertase Pin-like site-specific DNA recombinase